MSGRASCQVQRLAPHRGDVLLARLQFRSRASGIRLAGTGQDTRRGDPRVVLRRKTLLQRLILRAGHLAHLTLGSVHPDFVPGKVYQNVIVGFQVGWVSAFYITANLALGFRDDEREYSIAAHMLYSLQVKSIRLMTNNPRKINDLARYGIQITGRKPHVIPPNDYDALRQAGVTAVFGPGSVIPACATTILDALMGAARAV